MIVIYWILIAVIGIIGLLVIIYAYKEKSKSSMFGGVFALLAFFFGIVFNDPIITFVNNQSLTVEEYMYKEFPEVPDFGRNLEYVLGEVGGFLGNPSLGYTYTYLTVNKVNLTEDIDVYAKILISKGFTPEYIMTNENRSYFIDAEKLTNEGFTPGFLMNIGVHIGYNSNDGLLHVDIRIDDSTNPKTLKISVFQISKEDSPSEQKLGSKDSKIAKQYLSLIPDFGKIADDLGETVLFFEQPELQNGYSFRYLFTNSPYECVNVFVEELTSNEYNFAYDSTDEDGKVNYINTDHNVICSYQAFHMYNEYRTGAVYVTIQACN